MQDVQNANIVIRDSLDLKLVVIFTGIILGVLLSYFFLKKAKGKNTLHNSYLGFLMIAFVFIFTEWFLNYTLYILNMASITKFSEPFFLLIAPLMYLFTAERLGDKRGYRDWIHFIPFLFWLLYCVFFYIQPISFKTYYLVKELGLGLPYKEPLTKIPSDPLKLRHFFNYAVFVHMLFYIIVIYKRLTYKTKELGFSSIFKSTDRSLNSLRVSSAFFLVYILLTIYVRVTFQDFRGDFYLHLFITICFILFVLQIMFKSTFVSEFSAFLDKDLKYKSSSLDEENKNFILSKINELMVDEKYYIKNSASLAGLSKKIGETQHHVSQVINEKMNVSFFEMLATYRIEEAKKLLKSDVGDKYTIEEIAERVGYNSKSAFNSAFKKITSQTPSNYRSS